MGPPRPRSALRRRVIAHGAASGACLGLGFGAVTNAVRFGNWAWLPLLIPALLGAAWFFASAATTARVLRDPPWRMI